MLSAAHIFRGWSKQTDAHKKEYPIKATRYDKPGYTSESWLVLNPVRLGDADQQDVALLKLPQLSKKFDVAPICLSVGDNVRIGDPFISFGFPVDQSFQPVPGTLGTQNAAGGLWLAASAFLEGM